MSPLIPIIWPSRLPLARLILIAFFVTDGGVLRWGWTPHRFVSTTPESM